MVDRLSALDGHATPGRFGAGDSSGVTLSERRGLGAALLAAFPEDLSAVMTRTNQALNLELPGPGQSVEAGGVTALNIGPEKWLVTGEDSLDVPGKLTAGFADLPAVAVTDLSHARTVIRVSGPRARDLLAKDTPLDFHSGSFTPGQVKSSRFSHIAVTIHCLAEHTFDLYAFRSFGLALWEDLTDQAGDLGYEVAT